MADPASLYTTYNNDSEDREAFNILKEKSRLLASKFSNVKFEFSDLDGLRWRRRPSRTEESYTVLGRAMEATVKGNMASSTDDMTPRAQDSKAGTNFSLQLRPSSIVTPPLRSAQNLSTGSYFPPQRRSSLGKAAAGLKKSLSFKRKKDSQVQAEKAVVAVSLPTRSAGPDDSKPIDNDSMTWPYIGGTALYRAGYSTFVSETGAYEDSDSDSSSLTSTLDVEVQDEDDLETPRPLSTVREASCDSYFDDIVTDRNDPIKLPTVPSVPALELDLSQALVDSLNPDADLSTLPPPTLPNVCMTDPDATIKPISIPKRSIPCSELPFFCGSPSQKNVIPFPSVTTRRNATYPHPYSSLPTTRTTALSTVSVHVTFSPTLNNAATAKNEAHGFWSTSCVIRDSEATIRPITRRRISVPGLGDVF